MVETILMFLAKVVVVIIFIGSLVAPFYFLATLFYAIYKDCKCLNNADETSDNIFD